MSAFVELALTMGYESVVVGDIVRRANVGRSTFYLHYSNKESLLTESLKRPCAALAACAGRDATPQTLVPLLNHFREQRNVNRVFFESPVRRLWVRQLAVLIEPEVALHRRVSGRQRGVPRFLLAAVIAEMQVALVVHWLTRAEYVKSEIIAEALVSHTRAILACPRGA
jgi:AcrR family transcriptional regulator